MSSAPTEQQKQQAARILVMMKYGMTFTLILLTIIIVTVLQDFLFLSIIPVVAVADYVAYKKIKENYVKAGLVAESSCGKQFE